MLTKPVDRSKRRAKEDAFHDGESNQAGRKRTILAVEPPETPLSLRLDGRHRFYSSKQSILRSARRHEHLYEVSVGLRVNVLPETD